MSILPSQHIKNGDMNACAKELVQKAKDLGDQHSSGDNLTAIVVKMSPNENATLSDNQDLIIWATDFANN